MKLCHELKSTDCRHGELELGDADDDGNQAGCSSTCPMLYSNGEGDHSTCKAGSLRRHQVMLLLRFPRKAKPFITVTGGYLVGLL